MTPDSLRDLLIRWCHQNSGSDHLAGLEAMRGLLAAEFATLPGATRRPRPCAPAGELQGSEPNRTAPYPCFAATWRARARTFWRSFAGASASAPAPNESSHCAIQSRE